MAAGTSSTSDSVFVDTNVLIYAYDTQAGSKRQIATEVIQELWRSRRGRLSLQVLQEFYVNVTRRIPRPIARDLARDIVNTYWAWNPFRPDVEDLLAASQTEERFQVSFWDALIIRAAQRTHAVTLLSEDLNAGQRFDSVVVENPFADRN